MASAYGWSKGEILEDVYLDEALDYMDMIHKRKLHDYMMMLAIAQNPHTKKPEAMHKQLQTELRKLQNNDIMENVEPETGAFDKLRGIFKAK